MSLQSDEMRSNSSSQFLCNHPVDGWSRHSLETALTSSTLWMDNCSCERLSFEMAMMQTGLNVHCEPPPDAHPLLFELFYTLMFCFSIISSVVGNVIVIWIVLRHERMRTVTNYYLLNLAFADASISILNTGFTWRYILHQNWTWGSFLCHVNNLMGIAPITASVFTMIVMSIDRYWAVVHPLRKRPGKRATVLCIAIIWMTSFAIALPSWLASYVEHNLFLWESETTILVMCLADNFPDGNSGTSQLFAWYTMLLLPILQYVLPLCVLSYTYFRVGGVLRKKESVGDIRHYRNIAAKRKASKMLALVVLIFMVVWLPYQAFFVMESIFPQTLERDTSLNVFVNIYWLAMSSTMFNPIIYYFMNKRFRIGFKYAFRWLPCVEVDLCEYTCQLGSNCPRGTSILPSYHSTHNNHTTTNTLISTDF